MQKATRAGFLYGLAAYGWWGLVPIYLAWLGKTPPLHFVAHRIVWSVVFLALILTALGRWRATLRALATPRLFAPLVVSALLVGVNWLFYVLCFDHDAIVQASLGYFILPLVNVAMGLVLLRERPRPLQYVAIAVALVGVAWLTWSVGMVPWLSLGIAFSFSFYGLIRRHVPVDGVIGLTVETVVLLPVVLAYLAVGYTTTTEFETPELLFKLAISGVITAVPLLCFGEAARRLPFTMLGLMQYLAPSVQFVLAIWLFQEDVQDWTGYVIVWTALAVFSLDSYLWFRTAEQNPGTNL